MNLKDEFQLQLACLELWSRDNDRKPRSDDRCWYAVFYIFFVMHTHVHSVWSLCFISHLLGHLPDSWAWLDKGFPDILTQHRWKDRFLLGVIFQMKCHLAVLALVVSPSVLAREHTPPPFPQRETLRIPRCIFFTVILLMRETVSRDQLWSRTSHTKSTSNY